MSGNSEPVGTVEVALKHTARLLESRPELAAEQATEILKAVPGHPAALLMLGTARRLAGDAEGAVDILDSLARTQPTSALAHYELGVALGQLRRGGEAVVALRRAVALRPDLPDAWRAIGDHLTVIGDLTGADEAFARHLKASTRDPRLLAPATALCENKIAVAETLLRQHLKQFPTDVAAIRMLAEVAARLGRYGDAETLLARCLELAPSFTGARHNYALVLHRMHKEPAALKEIEWLVARDPRNPSYRNLKAVILTRIGEYTGAISIYGELLKQYPAQPKVWMSYGHALKTEGRQPDAIAAYRKSIELSPGLGESYWSLANLKTYRFTAADVEAMREQLKREDLAADDRFHFHFALGKAFEDAGNYAESFEHYAAGNRLRREDIDYDADVTAEKLRRSKAFYTQEFFAGRRGMGNPAADPIFIVGLPRAGSTLIEQILASHSKVEGTMELPDIIGIARTLGGGKLRGESTSYPEALANLGADELRALGEKYLLDTRIQRKTDAPFFIDKMPNNFLHTGLIELILPNAKIIDARRHPLGCCFSGFKQHFARGQNFSYGLEDIGRYYRDYVELMAHFDAVLPGRVHRVIYETMVEDTEGEVRRLLDYCGLDFEPACLKFYETERAVRTASSEQVRTPIYRDSVDQWRHYEPWLGPLKSALGRVLEVYPNAPEF